MSTKLVVALVAVPTLFVGLLLTADYAVVEVREGGPDGHHLIVPVPLAMARVGVAFAPPQAQYVEVPEIEPYIDEIEGAIEELRRAEDGVLVEVEDGGDHVLIRKVADQVVIDVEATDGEEVHVTVPLDTVVEILEEYDGVGFRTRDLLGAVGSIHGDLVHVRDGDEEVKVWIW